MQLCDLEKVNFDDDGLFDYDHLSDIVAKTMGSPRDVFVSLSAGSNVTGIKTDVFKAASIVKNANPEAKVFFDWAAVGPYVDIDLSAKCDFNQELPLIDGAFISPHKFIGGCGTSGVLIISNSIYR